MFGRFKSPIAVVLLLIAVAWQRAYWAQLAQWREDQACNLWLGYAQPLLQLPIGLISSVGTPNPNGMPLLAELLSQLPNLWVISSALGFVQGALVVWVCWLLWPSTWRWLLVALPVLSSVLLSATSVEFWNNWILASFDLAFFGCYISYQRSRSLWPIVGCVFLTLLAPAVYLAGLVNAVVYVVFVALLLLRHPPRRASWIGLRGNVPPLLAAAGVTGGMLFVTWLPFIHVMHGRELPTPPLTREVLGERLSRVFEAALDFPRWSIMHWYHNTRGDFLQNSPDIIGSGGEALLKLADWLLLTQSAVTIAALIVALARRSRPERSAPAHSIFLPGSAWQGRMLLSGLCFVWLSLLTSPLLGGPAWNRSERGDQQVQFLPILLVVCFALPLVLRLPSWLRGYIRGSTVALALACTLVNLVAGGVIVERHMRYDGDKVTLADMPLPQQRAVARFMAEDWKRVSSSHKIPVFYQHGQEWVIEFGKQLLPYYPAPMVVGRAIDFELSRVHGLQNAQEGVQVRSAKNARYIVTYAARPEPVLDAGLRVTHHKLGRLRVTVVER